MYVATYNGRLVQYLQYNSFGNVLERSGLDLRLPLGFAGGVVDRDTGLVRFGYRDYDPDVGRFIAPDPLGDTGGDHYPWEYCVDDPVNMVDPLGLQKEETGEKKGIVDGIVDWVSDLLGPKKSAEGLSETDQKNDDKWALAVDDMSDPRGAEGALVDRLDRIYTKDNRDFILESPGKVLDEMGEYIVEQPGKAVPRR